MTDQNPAQQHNPASQSELGAIADYIENGVLQEILASRMYVETVEQALASHDDPRVVDVAKAFGTQFDVGVDALRCAVRELRSGRLPA